MYINHDDLVTLATGPSGQGEAILQGLDRSRFPLGGTSFNFPSHREIVGHKRIVQNNKQLLSSLRRKARDRDLAPYRFSSLSRNVKFDPTLMQSFTRPGNFTCYLQSFTRPGKPNQCKVDK